MPRITFDKLEKTFGNNTVIKEFDAEVADKEFLVLLGPSGCGKSTMLRMIAGLTENTGGQLRFDGEVVDALEPRERNIAFVFQSYALYPHMTVRDNIAFPLIMDRFRAWHHVPIVNTFVRRAIARRPEVANRVQEVADLLELTNYLDRRPKTLSGGQRQRVAVARALVRDPVLYLLDEPLSNLDAKLRTQMRAEITALYRRVQKSFVYVTHDQVEAMTMATRIVVLNEGEIQQIGTPEEIYGTPANTFVAKFIGAPGMNLMEARITGGIVELENGAGVELQGELPADGSYMMGVRPEDFVVGGREAESVAVSVTDVEHLGGETVVKFQFPNANANADKPLSSSSLASTYSAKAPGTLRLPPGSDLHVAVKAPAVSWFDPETGHRVEPVSSTVDTAAN